MNSMFGYVNVVEYKWDYIYGGKQIGYERISLILHLFSYFWSNSDSNTDSVSHVEYNTIGY